jgi:ABC-type lipoprotein release transport system permease subunit
MLVKIAWLNIWRHPGRSLTIMGAVTIGLWSILFMSALYEGIIRQRINDVISNELSHIQVHHPAFRSEQEAMYTVPDGHKLYSALLNDPRNLAVTARLVSTGMVNAAGGSAGAVFVGVDPVTEQRVSGIYRSIVEGSYLKDSSKHEVVVGQKLARKLRLKVKSKLVLLGQDKQGELASGAFRIIGIYKTNNEPFDESHVFLHRNQLGSLTGTTGEFHEIALLLNNPDDVDAEAERLTKVRPDLEVKSWMELSPEMKLLVGVFDEYMLVLMLIIFLAVAFGIVNTMLMAVLERSRELGMMFAVGMNKPKVFLMVSLETLILMLVGLPVGILAGILTVWYTGVNGIRFGSSDMMSNFGFTNVVYPVLTTDHIWVAGLVITCITLIASLYPSYRAIRIKAVEAIRK